MLPPEQKEKLSRSNMTSPRDFHEAPHDVRSQIARFYTDRRVEESDATLLPYKTRLLKTKKRKHKGNTSMTAGKPLIDVSDILYQKAKLPLPKDIGEMIVYMDTLN
jgi:hypothetical protein